MREALRFSADLRQPFETPQEEKYAYVEEVISLLEMEDMADAIIGDPETGLAVEQRKRVTIGVELLLFLDEPTSGLDSQSAFNIVRFLRKLSAAGQVRHKWLIGRCVSSYSTRFRIVSTGRKYT